MLAFAMLLALQGEPKQIIPEEIEVAYADGSVIRASLDQESLDITTRYGKLFVPFKEIRSIDLGIHIPPHIEKLITKAIKELGDADYKKREKAVQTLVEHGIHSYPSLTRLVADSNDDLEIVKRASLAIIRIKDKYPARALRIREHDVVTTAAFTIVGRISSPAIKVKTENFGDLSVQLPRIRGVRLIGANHGTRIVLDVGKHSGSNNWHNTGYDVRSNARLVITAAGQIDLWPQSPGQYICNPNGYGSSTPGKPMTNGATIQNTKDRPGAVLGKVGEYGRIFVIGEEYRGTPGTDGRLFITAGDNPWSNPSSGTYEVRITVDRSLDLRN